MYVFVDSTKSFTVGLLDNNFNWLEYNFDPSNFVSEKIHSVIDDFLTGHKMTFTQVLGFIYIAGPGSYTGMRVAKGMADILEMTNVRTYSFCHFDVPKMLGITSGQWFAKAYKKQTFFYSWHENEEKFHLINDDKVQSQMNAEEQCFSHQREEECNGTIDLIKENPKSIFSYVVQNNLKKDLYYYRNLESEFNRNDK